MDHNVVILVFYRISYNYYENKQRVPYYKVNT